jgi:flagellar biosynthetic protein FliQ
VDALSELVRSSLVIIALLGLPVLIAATSVGTLVAVVQAATQIQEQTLTVLPKIVVVGLILVLFGNFGIHLCGNLFDEAIRTIPRLVSS